MTTYSLSEAQAQLPRLIARAVAGERIIIADGDQPPVMLVPASPPRTRRRPGSGKGQLLYMAPDFDQTPPEFEDADE